MADSFRGEYSQKIDAKARVSVPASFRRVLEAGDPDFKPGSRPRMILVYGDPRKRPCIGFTVKGMARLDARIKRMKTGSAARNTLVNFYTRRSLEVDIDDDGRIVLPPKAREKIGLAGTALADGAELVFAGTLDSFEVWNGVHYAAEADLAGAVIDDLLPEGEDLLSLLPDEDDDEDED